MIKKRQIYAIANLCVVSLLILGIMSGSYSVIAAAMVMILLLLFMRDVTESFYLFIALIPFQNYLTFWGKSGIPILLVALMINLLLNGKRRISTVVFCAISVLVMLEVMNDLFAVHPWTITNWCSFAIISIIFIDNIDLRKIEPMYVVMNMYFGVMAAVFANLGGSGNRFGSEYTDLGGAMGIPLYMLILTTLLLNYYIQDEPNRVQKIFVVANIVVLNALALLSISRAYLIGVAVILGCMVLSVFSRNSKKSTRILLLVVVCGFIVLWFKYDMFIQIVSRFRFRFEAHSDDDGRLGIWLSCLEFLGEHPKALVLGNGVLNYHNVGDSSYRFYQISAHNLYLDCIMAFGIVGTVGLLSIYRQFAQKCKFYYKSKANIISLMPILTLSAYYITSGSFRYFKTWMYYIIVILFIYIRPKKGENDDT